MIKLFTISADVKPLGVSPRTLRRGEREGRTVPTEKTAGGRWRCDLLKFGSDLLRRDSVSGHKTIAYARVSAGDQNEGLARQKKVLAMYCAAAGWDCKVVIDFDSGMNYHKKGLRRLIDGMCKAAEGV